MATTKRNPEDILQLKVALLGIRPPIWRRVLVPSAMTLGQLHDVIQLAFGWDDSHLHQLRIGATSFGPSDPFDSLGPQTEK